MTQRQWEENLYKRLVRLEMVENRWLGELFGRKKEVRVEESVSGNGFAVRGNKSKRTHHPPCDPSAVVVPGTAVALPLAAVPPGRLAAVDVTVPNVVLPPALLVPGFGVTTAAPGAHSDLYHA